MGQQPSCDICCILWSCWVYLWRCCEVLAVAFGIGTFCYYTTRDCERSKDHIIYVAENSTTIIFEGCSNWKELDVLLALSVAVGLAGCLALLKIIRHCEREWCSSAWRWFAGCCGRDRESRKSCSELLGLIRQDVYREGVHKSKDAKTRSHRKPSSSRQTSNGKLKARTETIEHGATVLVTLNDEDEGDDGDIDTTSSPTCDRGCESPSAGSDEETSFDDPEKGC